MTLHRSKFFAFVTALLSALPVFAYYSFSDLKTRSLGGSEVSSAYSNPAMLNLQENASLEAEYCDLFYGLDALGKPVPGYYAPDVYRKSLSILLPGKKYGFGFTRNQLSSPIHDESRNSLFASRNLNDLIMTRLDESINAAASLNFYSLKFADFPYSRYSNGASTFSFDLYLYTAFRGGVEYGFAFRNLGNTDIGINQRESIPKEFTFSASKRFVYSKLIFTYSDIRGEPELSAAARYRIGFMDMYSSIGSDYVSTAAGFSVRNKMEFLLGVSYPFMGDFALQPEISVKYYFGQAAKGHNRNARIKKFYNTAYDDYVDKKYTEAIRNWKEVLKIDPSHELSKTNIKKAVAAAKKYYFTLATKAYRNGRYREAISYWEKVLEFDPSHELSKKKIEKAEKALKSPPPASVSSEKARKGRLFRRASAEYMKGNYRSAIELWKKVLEIDPSHELSKIKIKKAEEKLKERGGNPEGEE